MQSSRSSSSSLILGGNNRILLAVPLVLFLMISAQASAQKQSPTTPERMRHLELQLKYMEHQHSQEINDLKNTIADLTKHVYDGNVGQHAGGRRTQDQSTLDSSHTVFMFGNIVWVLAMTVPGLALFYGGLVRVHTTVSTVMQSFSIACLISIEWVVIGYSLSFSERSPLIGGGEKAFLLEVNPSDKHHLRPDVPETAFMMYQGMFAIITTAIITGSWADRCSYFPVMLFCALWHLVVYVPICHANWMTGGFLYERKVLDFAGGNCVHIAAGCAGLVASYIIGDRNSDTKTASAYSILFSVLGASMLWCGWLNFNGGSAGTLEQAGTALVTTQISGAVGGISWMLTQVIHGLSKQAFKARTARKQANSAQGADGAVASTMPEEAQQTSFFPCCRRIGKNTVATLATPARKKRIVVKPSVIGMINGCVAGLVIITPGAGYVEPWSAFIFGMLGGSVCYLFSRLKFKLGIDDTLDTFAIHGIGGILGGLLTGIFASPKASGLDEVSGWIEGNPHQVWLQFVGVSCSCTWAILGTGLVMKFMKGCSHVLSKMSKELEHWNFCMLRVQLADELDGIDFANHGESIVKKPTSELDEVSATMSLNPTPSESQSPDNSIHRGDLARHIELEPRTFQLEGTRPTKEFKEFALDIVSQCRGTQLPQPFMSEAPCADNATDQ